MFRQEMRQLRRNHERTRETLSRSLDNLRRRAEERARAASNLGGQRCDWCGDRAVGHTHSPSVFYLCDRHRRDFRSRNVDNWDFEWNDGREEEPVTQEEYEEQMPIVGPGTPYFDDGNPVSEGGPRTRQGNNNESKTHNRTPKVRVPKQMPVVLPERGHGREGDRSAPGSTGAVFDLHRKVKRNKPKT